MQLPPTCTVLFGISSKRDELLLFKEINVFLSLISEIGMLTILRKDLGKDLFK
jgi:hypothetical protein